MLKTANRIIRQAEKWIGLNEADGSFKRIIDLYNSTYPIPRGYKASYTSEWCAITITALGYATGMSDLVGAECSVPKLMAQYKAKGIWLGPNVTPQPGDIVIYDWDSARDGDHIGIIEKVSGNYVTAIEGNMSGTTVNGQYLGKVGRRTFTKGWSRVTGYARPKYDDANAVFRLYNPKSGDHFFTVNPVEADNANRYGGYNDEGVAFYASKKGSNVYRVYNPSTGEHFYTASASERDTVCRSGWKSEGIAFKASGAVPVYRLYNRKHMFTVSEGERDSLIRAGWKNEGIGWKTLAK